MFTHQILDITWKYTGKYWQSWRLLDLKDQSIKELPLEGYKFQFNLSHEKYCTGYSIDGEWRLCPKNKLITRSHAIQCFDCEREEGFKSAFLFGNVPNENAKVHLNQPFYIYLAYFYPDIIKVGAAANRRLRIRPIEQDALIYSYIAKAPDGFVVQDLEHAISKQLGLTEAVRSNHKLKSLWVKPDLERASDLILRKYNEIFSKFGTNDVFSSWLYDKSEVKVVDLTGLKNLHYPDSDVLLLKNATVLFGDFKGLRGRFVLFENYGIVYALDEREIIGKHIEWVDNEHRYESAKKDEQLGFFSL